MVEVYPLIERNKTDLLANLSPLLRLLQNCYYQVSGSVAEIDGVLGCPLVMFPPTLLEVRSANYSSIPLPPVSLLIHIPIKDWSTNSPHVQEGICFALFYAISW